MIKAGLSVAGAGSVGQLTKNLDYFVVGQLAGLGTLGSYRVAFELAMAPTLAILQVINRSALPVFSRLAGDVTALRNAFAWTARSALLLVLAPLLLVFFEGSTIVTLLGKEPEPYLRTVLQCLCGAALLRTIAQAYPQVFVAKGFPARSLIEAVATICLLTLMLVLCLLGLESWPVMVRVALAWLLAYVALQPVDMWLARELIPGNVRALFGSLRAPLLLALLLAVLLQLTLPLSPIRAPGLRALLHGGLIVGLYVLGLRVVVGVTARGLVPRRAAASTPPDGETARGEPVA
jgi:O-antigen/teichoic acid export membrane protein